MRTTCDMTADVTRDGETTHRLWRRDAEGKTICNACGLQARARRKAEQKAAASSSLQANMMPRGSANGTPEAVARHHAPALPSPTAAAAQQAAAPSPAPARAPPVPPAASAPQSAAATSSGAGAKLPFDEQLGSCPGGGHCNGQGGQACCQGCPTFNNRVMHAAHAAAMGASTSNAGAGSTSRDGATPGAAAAAAGDDDSGAGPSRGSAGYDASDVGAMACDNCGTRMCCSLGPRFLCMAADTQVLYRDDTALETRWRRSSRLQRLW